LNKLEEKLLPYDLLLHEEATNLDRKRKMEYIQ
jgi:hypothetical protein